MKNFDDLTPEEREEFRDVLAKQSNAELEQYFDRKLPEILAATKQAMAGGNDEAALKRIASGIGAFEAKLSQWNDACGKRASKKLIAVVETLSGMRSDIQSALRGELPGQQNGGDEEGEAWKG